MKKFRILAIAFIAIAILLSDIMCAHVAYAYSEMLWRTSNVVNSAGPDVAFCLAIPYIVGILICIILSCFLWRKSNQ